MINSISILFPIYNEEKRIENSLKKIDIFLNKKKFKKIEILLIDDGSTDRTTKLINNFLNLTRNKKKIKLILIKKNSGKGYALMQGVKLAKNDWILTIDIDLSVKLEQLLIWRKKYIKKNTLVYFGSRSHKLSIIKKNLMRDVLGILFKILSFLFFRLNISDTQCGFKLYKKNVAEKVFKKLIENGYVHDIEIAFRCLKNKFKIKELPVTWNHKPDGKVNILYDPFIMLFALIKLKIKLK